MKRNLIYIINFPKEKKNVWYYVSNYEPLIPTSPQNGFAETVKKNEDKEGLLYI